MQAGRRYEPINYHELVGDLRERVETLERRFRYLLEGIDRVVEDGETIRAHVQQVRGMTRWMKKRDAIDMEESIFIDKNRSPPLLEAEFIEPQNEIEREKRKSDKIKTKPIGTRTEEIEKLRRRIDKARDRMNSHETKKATPRLLFRGIEEGKKALSR